MDLVFTFIPISLCRFIGELSLFGTESYQWPIIVVDTCYFVVGGGDGGSCGGGDVCVFPFFWFHYYDII